MSLICIGQAVSGCEEEIKGSPPRHPKASLTQGVSLYTASIIESGTQVFHLVPLHLMQVFGWKSFVVVVTALPLILKGTHWSLSYLACSLGLSLVLLW